MKALLLVLAVVAAMFWSFIRLCKGLVIDRAGGYIRKGNQLLVDEDSPLAKAGYARRMPLDEVHWSLANIFFRKMSCFRDCF